MPTVNESPHLKTTPRRCKWMCWALILAAVVLGLATLRVVSEGGFTGRGSSGKYAKLLFTLHETNFYPSSVAWSPDGQYIATASSAAKNIHIWNVKQRKIIKVLQVAWSAPWFHELAFSPDGQYLAACDGTGVLRVYQTGTWTTVHVFSELHAHGGCDHPVFSSDSQRIAAGLGYLTVISVPDWRIIKRVLMVSGWGRGNLYNAVAYVPNTHTVLVGGGGSTSRSHFLGKNREAGMDAYGSLNLRIKHLAKPFECIVRIAFAVEAEVSRSWQPARMVVTLSLERRRVRGMRLRVLSPLNPCIS